MNLEQEEISKVVSQHFGVDEKNIKVLDLNQKDKDARLEIGFKKYRLKWSRVMGIEVVSILQAY